MYIMTKRSTQNYQKKTYGRDDVKTDKKEIIILVLKPKN